jgi:hypothetical protein
VASRPVVQPRYLPSSALTRPVRLPRPKGAASMAWFYEIRNSNNAGLKRNGGFASQTPRRSPGAKTPRKLKTCVSRTGRMLNASSLAGMLRSSLGSSAIEIELEITASIPRSISNNHYRSGLSGFQRHRQAVGFFQSRACSCCPDIE